MEKNPELTAALLEEIKEAAAAGARSAWGEKGGAEPVNYFKVMESLLRNYKRLEKLMGDEEAYCAVEQHSGRRWDRDLVKESRETYVQTDEERLEELREQRRQQYQKTLLSFEQLRSCIKDFEQEKEFAVIRLYYFGENVDGTPREDGRQLTWEEITDILSEQDILREVKTARRWRNNIIDNMAVCLFGIPAAISAGTSRRK